jgi:hypothetical protein
VAIGATERRNSRAQHAPLRRNRLAMRARFTTVPAASRTREERAPFPTPARPLPLVHPLQSAARTLRAGEKDNMRNYLLALTMVAAALTEACTGGGITDPNGNLLTGTNGKYEVEFRNTASDTTYYTTVDNYGYFGFDAYAPAGGSNNAVFIPEGTYQVSVLQAGDSYVTPFTIQHTYSNNSSCPDHYDSASTHEPCALYQLELLDSIARPGAPYASSYLGFATTVIPLAPQVYPSITVTSSGQSYTIRGVGFEPNGFAFWKATGEPHGELFADDTVTATTTGTMVDTWQMCFGVGGTDTSVVIVGFDEETGIYSNTVTVTPPKCGD